MWELFQKGGFMMYPILLSSILALAIIIERAIIIAQVKIPTREDILRLCEFAKNKDYEALKSILQTAKTKTPIFVIFRELWNAEGDEHAHEKTAELVGDSLIKQYSKRINWLSILGSLVPLMGLLGTVLGMIKVFSKVADAGDISDISLLAGGIWEALITTAAGMAVAIPVLICFYWLNNRIDKISFYMSHNAETFITALRMDNFKK